MSEAPVITEGPKASSMGERLHQAFAAAGAARMPFHEMSPELRKLYDETATAFVASLTYAEVAGVREALLSSVLLEALKAARDELNRLGELVWKDTRTAAFDAMPIACAVNAAEAAIRQAEEAA